MAADRVDEIEMLPGEGDVRFVKRTRMRHECDVCGEPATHKVTFLLHNARHNPGSTAFGRDDCTWCSDDEAFACKSHAEQVRRNEPVGMSWCSTFDGARHPAMLLYWWEERA